MAINAIANSRIIDSHGRLDARTPEHQDPEIVLCQLKARAGELDSLIKEGGAGREAVVITREELERTIRELEDLINVQN